MTLASNTDNSPFLGLDRYQIPIPNEYSNKDIEGTISLEHAGMRTPAHGSNPSHWAGMERT
jgi:hypothetical protein